MKTIIGINGSPRKNANSATMLEHALKGAESAGAKAETIHLVDLNFCGCQSCFACKKLGGTSFGKCAVQDELTPVLEKILNADALVVAAPVYFEDVPGMVRNFYERLAFPSLLYNLDNSVAYDKHLKAALIYTMNCPDPHFHDHVTKTHLRIFNMMIGDTALLQSTMTWQFDDYSKYSGDRFDVEARWNRHVNIFPKDCEKAFALGKSLVTKQ